MTKEELSELKNMTKSEICKKYTPLLVAKKITTKQYHWLCAQAKDVEDDMKTVHELLSAFGGRVIDN